MKDLNLINFNRQFPNEDACIDYLAKLRWDGSPICQHCGSLDAYGIPSRHIFKCRDCKKQFSVRTGTIFEESRLPLQKWFYAIYLLTSQKKGISSVRMAEYLDITQKTAWFMLQRIRYALNYGYEKPLEGVVEVDETYIGGKQRGKEISTQDKEVVLGIVEREGKAVIKHVKSSGARVILPHVQKAVKPGATIYSDQYRAYRTLPRMGYTHDSVNHSALEFSRGNTHTNTVEGMWAHLKLGLKAIYMGVSSKHLVKYVDEFGFRYNTREMKDGERFERYLREIQGKRLTYEQLSG